MTDISIKTHKALADVSRSRILEELRGQGALDSRELGRLIGLHPNTVRSHVDQLIEAGLVNAVSAPASGRGRPRVLYEAIVYEAIADSASVQQGGYRLLAQILASTDQPQAVAESAGRAWGSYLTEKPQPFSGISADEATQKVVELFDELGFMPEALEESVERKVLLHRCPFREVAESNQRVVCAVHLGMLKGALAEMGPRCRPPVSSLSWSPPSASHTFEAAPLRDRQEVSALHVQDIQPSPEPEFIECPRCGQPVLKDNLSRQWNEWGQVCSCESCGSIEAGCHAFDEPVPAPMSELERLPATTQRILHAVQQITQDLTEIPARVFTSRLVGLLIDDLVSNVVPLMAAEERVLCPDFDSHLADALRKDHNEVVRLIELLSMLAESLERRIASAVAKGPVRTTLREMTDALRDLHIHQPDALRHLGETLPLNEQARLSAGSAR